LSAVARPLLDVATPPARRPGTAVRLLLLFLAAAGGAAVLAVGFPRGAPDRLPVLVLSIGFAVAAVARPNRTLTAFGFLFPVAGVLARAAGAVDPAAWPVLLFGGLAVGWTFRFLYDFESAPDPSVADPALRALAVVWALATGVAIARAKTWWEIARGLTGRAVNSAGLPEAVAVRESVLTFAILAAGAGFFFLLRRAGAAARLRATRAALAGSAVAASLAVLQAVRILPGETRSFWKVTGRLSGGATDPNALGLLCGLAIPPLLVLALGTGKRRWAIPAVLSAAAGLVLSGSRSGFLVAVLGGFAAVLFAPARRRLGAVLFLAALVAILLAAGVMARGAPGDVGERLGDLFRPSLSLDDRASSRPVLWRAAGVLFRESPVEGGGLGSFAWRLPDLAGVEGRRLALRDNPGSGYLQALAETGVLGFVAMLVFVGVLARSALRRFREHPGESASVLALLVVLLVGSHWLAPEAGLLFFLLAADVAAPASGQTAARPARLLLGGLVAMYGVFAARAVLGTDDPAQTFRYSDRAGFYARETGKGGPFQWTRRRFALSGPAGGPGRIALANYSAEGKPIEVTVAADDGPVLFRRTLPSGAGVRLTLSSGARPRVFRFALSRSFVPKRLGLADRRELGVVAVTPEE
jgi:O-antigen ligase